MVKKVLCFQSIDYRGLSDHESGKEKEYYLCSQAAIFVYNQGVSWKESLDYRQRSLESKHRS